MTRLLDGGGDGSGDPAILVSVVEVGAGHKPCDLVAGGGGPALELGKHTVASLRATTCVTAALQKRRTAATGLNATSSRTHGIVVLRLAEGGTLVVCDLAGADNAARAGTAIDKTIFINSSLSNLKTLLRKTAKM